MIVVLLEVVLVVLVVVLMVVMMMMVVVGGGGDDDGDDVSMLTTAATMVIQLPDHSHIRCARPWLSGAFPSPSLSPFFPLFTPLSPCVATLASCE